MSRIDKLSISGVRNFAELPSEVIHFNTPLTLIVGYNGSGKTTIIECLKYATTGMVPPNSAKGAYFVHDPKLTGNNETKAQVRLGFHSTAGHQMTATRNMGVTIKKKTVNPTFGTAECTLLIRKDGERTVVSSRGNRARLPFSHPQYSTGHPEIRLADMDALLPQYIGVSRAVLDNVIFCHQEESLWPMSEPSKLKTKFDEIFEAVKWTGAMKNIGDMQKAKKSEIGAHRVRQDMEKINKDRGAKAQKKSEDLHAEIELLYEENEVLVQNIKTASQTQKEKWEKAQKALSVVDDLKTRRSQAAYLQGSVDDLKPNIEELDESTESLRSTLSSFAEKVDDDTERRDYLRSQYSALQESSTTLQRNLSAKQTELGQRQAEKDSHEQKIKSRAQLVREAADKHSLRGYAGDLDQEQIGEFVSRIRNQLRDRDRELERIKESSQDEGRQIQIQIRDLDNRKAARTQDKLNARQNIAENVKKSNLKQREMNRIEMDEFKIDQFTKNQADVQNRLRTLKSEIDAAQWDKHIKDDGARHTEAEAERQRLMHELQLHTKLSSDRAQLVYVQTEVKKARDTLATMKSTYGARLNGILGSNWHWDKLSQEFQTVMDQHAEAVADAKTAQDGAKGRLREAEFKLQQSRSRLESKKEELKQRQAKVLQSILLENNQPLSSIEDYPRELEILQNDLQETRGALESGGHFIKYYNTAHERADKGNACVLCDRPFTDPQHRSSALEKISRQLARYKEKLEKESVVELEQELSTALKARSDYELCKTLSVEIADLLKEVSEGVTSKDSLVTVHESRDADLRKAQSTQADLQGFSSTVKVIVECMNSISKFDGDISKYSTQQSLSGSSLTENELYQQQADCEDRLHNLKTKIDKMRTDRDQAIRSVASLEIELSNISNTLNTGRHQLEKKQALLADIDALRRSDADSERAIREADSDLEALAPQIATLSTQSADAQKSGRAKEREVQQEITKLGETSNNFKILEDGINHYLEGRGAEMLAACLRAIKALKQEQEGIKSEVDQITNDVKVVEKLLSDSERHRSNISNNLLYRKQLAELGEVAKAIRDLEAQNVTGDYDRLEKDAHNAATQLSILESNRTKVATSITLKDMELANAISLWETDYRDAADNFQEARIKVETTKAVIEDLGKYHKALEAAIMKHHTVKMEQINQIAGELWRQTYQGSDIDTIMIKSESENATTKRAYNYRVVMVKSNAEMDMRGRCSAGQKVLASIVLRLALAECFGVNCGIIALDEPTTNLDEDNIKALASSLHQIIKNRKSQSNFQLIVITHDETFLKEMKCQEFCDTFFRVSRNNLQKSNITTEDIGQLMY